MCKNLLYQAAASGVSTAITDGYRPKIRVVTGAAPSFTVIAVAVYLCFDSPLYQV